MRNRPSWRLDPDELGVLAELLRLSRWPFPFSVRPPAALRDEQRARNRSATQRLTAGDLVRGGRVEPDLESAVRTLDRPLWSVDAHGWSGDAPESLLRVLGASTGPAGVVGVQAPGEDDQVGGHLDLQVVAPSEVCSGVARALPAAAAGREPRMQVDVEQLRSRASDSVAWSVQPSAAELDRKRLARLIAEPFSGGGQLGLTAAVSQGPPLRRSPLRWIDRPHDGRYLLSGTPDVVLAPADTAVITDALATELQTLLHHR